MRKIRFRFLIAIAPFLLGGCVGADGRSTPLFPSYSAPDPPVMAPPLQSSTQDPGNLPGVRETHGVVHRADCDKLEQKFLSQGRNIKLVDRTRSTNPGAQLQWICIFEGPDVQEGYFDDHRYNSTKEY